MFFSKRALFSDVYLFVICSSVAPTKRPKICSLISAPWRLVYPGLHSFWAAFSDKWREQITLSRAVEGREWTGESGEATPRTPTRNNKGRSSKEFSDVAERRKLLQSPSEVREQFRQIITRAAINRFPRGNVRTYSGYPNGDRGENFFECFLPREIIPLAFFLFFFFFFLSFCLLLFSSI